MSRQLVSFGRFAPALCLIVLLLLPCQSGLALDLGRALSQYGHTAWRLEDGVFKGPPHAIAQTADGYLWVGTESGLERFDGVRFADWNPPDGKPITAPAVVSLLAAHDGTLWIGTKDGLNHWDGKVLTRYAGSIGRISAIAEDRAGKIWLARAHIRDADGPLCLVVGNGWQCHGKAEGISLAAGTALVGDKDGALWLGGPTGICRWQSGAATCFIPDVLRQNQGLAGVTAISPVGDGSVLVGFAQAGPGLGLQYLRDGSWHPYQASGPSSDNVTPNSLLRDQEGVLWVGAETQGLIRFHDSQREQFGSGQGLSSDYVEGLLLDHEGNLWTTTTRGVDRFRNLPVATFSTREGLSSDTVTSVLASPDNTIWIGNRGSLEYLRQGKISSITKTSGLPGSRVTSLFQSHDGTLWIGLDQGLAACKDGHFRSIRSPDGQDLGIILGMAEDVESTVWAAVLGKPKRAVGIRGGVVVDEVHPPHAMALGPVVADPKHGIWLPVVDEGLVHFLGDREETFSTQGLEDTRIRNFLVESDGSAWAVSNRGLIYWNNTERKILDSHNGLPCDSLFALIRDDSNAMWLSGNCGFIRISESDLERWIHEPSTSPRMHLLDSFDGSQAADTAFRPAATKSPDGRLWFANENVVQMIDPQHLYENPLPPPVHIEKAIADRKTYSDLENLRLPPLTRDLEIDYTALSYSVPQRVRFRYMLEGHDGEWMDAGTRRQAFYNDLRPGAYRFRVIACNDSGVWNETGASFAFRLLPAFYQTSWFLLLCGILVAALVWFAYAWRIRLIEARLDAQFNARLAERTRIAQELHDTLLQGFLGASMQLHLVEEEIPAESPLKSRLLRILQLMSQVIAEGRNALRGLRATDPESDNLEQAFSRLPQEFASPQKIEFRVIAEGDVRPVRRLIRDDVYRIGREAVANAFQHARASTIEVEIEYAQDKLRVAIRDDGCGIDSEVLRVGRDGHWGLTGMRERAERIGARLRVWSRHSGGTEVDLVVPSKLAFQSSVRLGWLRRSKWS